MTLQPHFFETARADAVHATADLGGIRERLPEVSVILVGRGLSVSGTSSAEPTRLWEGHYVHEFEATASGLAWEQDPEGNADAETTRQAISELRRISGLTWEQLGELFDVSRRSVHFWASGKPLNAGNEQRLMEVLDIVRTADRGDARSTRSALLDVHDGSAAFDLLVEERFDEARAQLGVGGGRPRPVLGELSAEAKAARAPLRPEELVEAQHDRIHPASGRLLTARPIKTRRK